MKHISILAFTLLIAISTSAQFGNNFKNSTLRLDYVHAGTHDTQTCFFEGFRIEPFWGGTQTNLIDTLKYGNYFFEVKDFLTEKIIYSRGYSSLFGEWQTTLESKEIQRSFYESIVMPLPKNKAVITIYWRNKKGLMDEMFTATYNPDDYFVTTELRKPYPSFDVFIGNKDVAKAVDIVILPEGYTEEEMGKFISDCKAFSESLFSFQPYGDRKSSFNIRGILAPSVEHGCDIPADSIYVNTIMNATFYTFDSERYCMTTDHYSVRDLAANAPYDQIYILINTKKYGGGAIYNFYSSSVTGNGAAAKIIVHEFGHAFAGLADEYYDSSTSYNDFYPLDVEPWEPNITTLVHFEKKWKNLMSPNTPIPTEDIRENENVLGVYEGGGYSAKGIYRPKRDCLMNTFAGDQFCPACYRAINTMIDFYSK